MSYADDHDNYGNSSRPPVRYENTYQLEPTKKFPQREVKYILKDVLDGYLAEEKYEPELCKQMTKTLSEVVKARIRDLQNVRSTRYKIVCIVHIGQLKDQAMQIGSRCLWDPANDSSASYEFKNKSLFAIGSVFFVYNEWLADILIRLFLHCTANV